jgi:acyl-CoA thioesterase
VAVNRFDTDTAVEPLGSGRYRARIDEGWWAGAGPNGGYVGAILLRALELEVGDPARACRSFTVHYLSRPDAGPAEVEVTVERSGRSMTSVSARLTQGGRALAIAVAALSTPRPGPEFCDVVMPEGPDPEHADDGPFSGYIPRAAVPSLGARYEYRRTMGPAPFSGGDEALTGGWIRLAEPRPVDASVLVAYVDAWMPAMFGRFGGPWGMTTVDLTVHVRSLPPEGYDDWCLLRFRSVVSADGFCEEDGEVWTRDGQLLAQSRQLAALIALR